MPFLLTSNGFLKTKSDLFKETCATMSDFISVRSWAPENYI